MMVRIREACPGQSTRVNCRLSNCFCFPLSRRWSGRSTVKEEKPRSSVMPLSRDCGFLSKAAVEAVLLSALASDVFPLSTCPSTPTLKFRVLVRLSAGSDISTQVWCNDSWRACFIFHCTGRWTLALLLSVQTFSSLTFVNKKRDTSTRCLIKLWPITYT